MLSDISLSFTGVRSLSNVQATLLQSPETIRHRQGYILRDGSISKKSTNGCFYNGKKVERLKLAHLDTIYLAPTLRLIYLDEGFHKISRDLEATLADAFDAGNFEDT
jgi:pSer/pThr/pTyr-binding forkhead associated (FHA) protein